MAAALSRGALQWIRLPAPKRAVWVCFQAARVLTPLRRFMTGRGFFVPCPVRSLRAVRRLPRRVIPRARSCADASGDRGLVMNEPPPTIRIGPSVSVL
jgi:hypothetical protein